MKFGREFFTENSQTSTSSVKIGSVTVVFYVWAQINWFSDSRILRVGADKFLHFLSIFLYRFS